MTEDSYVPLFCPKCGEGVPETTADLDLDSLFICAQCGNRCYWRDLKVQSGESLFDYVSQLGPDAFKNFKPPR
ncbi:MAG TPA: hypothetical protein VFG44_09395 [Burkholderiales bacterium]|jgi:hypothetical protein|nr:hypothetical protein [Burkholderiales bacterium]